MEVLLGRVILTEVTLLAETVLVLLRRTIAGDRIFWLNRFCSGILSTVM